MKIYNLVLSLLQLTMVVVLFGVTLNAFNGHKRMSPILKPIVDTVGRVFNGPPGQH
jgi:hypothetical protein